MSKLTHVAHIDIDEYIVLKQHSSIKDFIKEYIYGNCAGIGMNWRTFGCNDYTEASLIPEPIRFTKCELKGNIHIKTLFNTSLFNNFREVHSIKTKNGMYIKNTNGENIEGCFNHNIDFSTIQLNHYKCKTLPEFKLLRLRGRGDLNNFKQPIEDIEATFNLVNINEIEELTAHNFFYLNNLI